MKETTIKYPFLTKDVKIYEQDNGHKIVLAYKEGGMVNVSSWVKTGSINENDKNNADKKERWRIKNIREKIRGCFLYIWENSEQIIPQ